MLCTMWYNAGIQCIHSKLNLKFSKSTFLSITLLYHFIPHKSLHHIIDLLNTNHMTPNTPKSLRQNFSQIVLQDHFLDPFPKMFITCSNVTTYKSYLSALVDIF